MIVAFCLLGAAGLLAESIGSIEVLQGEVELNEGQQFVRAGELRALFERELLITSTDTRLLIHLSDGSKFAVSGNTQLSVLEMFESDEGPSLWTILLARGALRWQSSDHSNFACHVITDLGSLGYYGDWLECAVGDDSLKCRGANGSRGVWLNDQPGLIDFSKGMWQVKRGEAPARVHGKSASLLEEGGDWPSYREGAREFFWRDYRDFREHLKNLRQEVRDQINQLIIGAKADELV